MPRGKKTGGRNFLPGQSGNPNGRPNVPEDLKQARNLNRIELDRLLNKMLGSTKAELETILKNPSSTLLEITVCGILAKAAQGGDHQRLNFILERLVGKVKDVVEFVNPYLALPLEELEDKVKEKLK